jgi:hypothetical protein
MHGKLNLNKETFLQKKFTTDESCMLDQEPKNQGSLDVMFACPVRAMTRLLFTIEMGAILTTRMAFHVQGKVY